jgi:hypothetical protein
MFRLNISFLNMKSCVISAGKLYSNLSGFFICILTASITAVSVGLASRSLEKPGHEVSCQLDRADLAQPAAQVAHQVGAVQAQRQHAQQQPPKLQAKHILLLEPVLRIHDILVRIRIRGHPDANKNQIFL